MKIGELSRRVGISVRMLRYYEAQGLLTPERTVSGYRDYGATEVETVRHIKALGAAGMTLPVISAFLPCALSARGEFEPCHELRAAVRQQIAKVDERLACLSHSRQLLEDILNKLVLPNQKAS